MECSLQNKDIFLDILEVQRTFILKNILRTHFGDLGSYDGGHSIWSTTVMSVCCQCLTLNKDLFLLCGSLTNVTSIQKYLQSLPVCCPLTFCSSQQIQKHICVPLRLEHTTVLLFMQYIFSHRKLAWCSFAKMCSICKESTLLPTMQCTQPHTAFPD